MVATEGLGPGGEIEVELLGVRPGNGPVDADALKAFTEHTVDVIETWYQDPIDFAAYSTDSNVPLSLGIVVNTVGTVRGALRIRGKSGLSFPVWRMDFGLRWR